MLMPSSEVSVTSGTWSLVITEKRGMAGQDQDETARSERTWERERKEPHWCLHTAAPRVLLQEGPSDPSGLKAAL